MHLKIYWLNMLRRIHVKFSLCYGLGFPISLFRKISRLPHSDISVFLEPILKECW